MKGHTTATTPAPLSGGWRLPKRVQHLKNQNFLNIGQLKVPHLKHPKSEGLSTNFFWKLQQYFKYGIQARETWKYQMFTLKETANSLFAHIAMEPYYWGPFNRSPAQKALRS